ncbi:hypothetical protein AB0F81_41480 [Actinoplanes sp. NPDC024001]|uniref:hypothetical protein n=1 Tax=Actinoplanes sp. NPDC024001 TaxID=3154598 RepID=UPI0033FBBD85
MNDGGAGWTDVAGVVTAVVSVVIALVAVVIAVRTDSRSREVIKIQTYLALRSRFLDLYQKLGKLDDGRPPDDPALRLARAAYWHHCWDEWFISERLSRTEVGGMWQGFFSRAMLSGLRHPALRKALEELKADEQFGFGNYAREFIDELDRIAETEKR